mmetsp:Transcript_47003/g.102259  ORF Transcript_47003/g.102259 Transcript_47003/m.102259 type:complete len:336 (+) Transcript_47003:24-1031(+)
MLSNRLTKLLGCDHPVMLAGMGGIADKELVAAVSKAGGFGTWGGASAVSNMDLDQIRQEVKEMAVACEGKPFGVDILIHGKDGGLLEPLIDAYAEGGARVFITGKGYPNRKATEMCRRKGLVVGSICGTVMHAKNAVELGGVDFVIAQGSEGGGHTGVVASSVLIPQVVDAVGDKVPVVAAGGIFDGRGLAAALCYGADGVWVGTRFLLTPEANAHQTHKDRLILGRAEDTVISRAFTGATLRVMRNKWTQHYEEHPEELGKGSKQLVKAMKEGAWLHSQIANKAVADQPFDEEIQGYAAGQCIGNIERIQPAGDIVVQMVGTAAQLLGRSQAKL